MLPTLSRVRNTGIRMHFQYLLTLGAEEAEVMKGASGACVGTNPSPRDISNKEYTYISSLELMVYFLKLLTHI